MKVEIDIPDGLRPETVRLVTGFATAMAAKLMVTQVKRANEEDILDRREWDQVGPWEYELNRCLVAAVGKGDPIDVAAYAAFAWGLKYRTSLRSVLAMLNLDEGLR